MKDNGKLRRVTSFVHGEKRDPLRIVFLIESSDAQVSSVNGLVEALPHALHYLHPVDSIGIASVFPGYKILLAPTVNRAAIHPALDQLRANQQQYLKNPKAYDATFDFNNVSRSLVNVSKTMRSKNLQLVVIIVTDDFDLLDPKTSAQAAEALVKDATTVAAFVDSENPGIAIARKNVRIMEMATPMRLWVRDRGASYFAKQTGGPVVHVRNHNYQRALETLLRTLSDAYLVGFTPKDSELDGKYHKLKISVKREALKGQGKVRVRYRKGYWADR